MKAKSNDPKSALFRAMEALRKDEPSPEAVNESRARGRARLFAESDTLSDNSLILGCEAIQSLLVLYRRSGLEAKRALLVRNHLAECADCREVYARRGSLRLATTPWKSDARLVASAPLLTKRTWSVLAAAAAVLCVALLTLRLTYFSVPTGQRAIVQAVSGTLYRVDGSVAESLASGATLAEGQLVRSGNSPQSLLKLTDGSIVELGERAEFSLAMRGRDTTVRLHRGQIIVQAAKRKTGHLYVEAPDCRVAVTGTVFSVLTSLKGSRVSVIEGEVHVAQSAGIETVLHRGDQVTTAKGLRPVPIEREIAWSRNLNEHLALLNALTVLRDDWAKVSVPGLRHASKLTNLVPDNTIVYGALPNYGETLNEGYRLFKTRLNDNAMFKKWWDTSVSLHEGAGLDVLVAKMHELASFLGGEVVIAGSLNGDDPELVILAEAKTPGLEARIGNEITLPTGESLPITVVDAFGAKTLGSDDSTMDGAILLVTPEVIALSPSRAAIQAVVSRLESNARGAFIASRLGERVQDAYQNGVGLLVAADLEMLTAASVESARDGSTEKGPVHLIFERKVAAGQTLNSGKLVFDGPREGLASWLAPPSPMGSLNFFTPQTSAVAALLMKRPAEVLKDISSLAPSGITALQQLAKVEADWNVRIREDIADALGSEVAFAIDGPLLPQPAWKLVVEVEDAIHLERGIESLLRRANQEMQHAGAGALMFEQERVGAFNYHRIKTRDSAIPFEVNYAFVDGYLVMTPTSALLSRAIQAHARGDTLARSARFRDLLPQDGQAVLSGLLFQDLLGLVATTLDSAEVPVAPELKQSFGKLSRDSKPTLVGLYGCEDSIEMVGTGDLLPLGPEALALPGLLRHTFPGAFRALEN